MKGRLFRFWRCGFEIFIKRRDFALKQADRFETVYRQKHIGATLDVVEILADRETGVQYLFYQSRFGGGLTPLLDKDGKPVIAPGISPR